MIHSVDAELTPRGFVIHYQGTSYNVSYPEGVWQQTPETVRLFLLDNLTFAMTMHLPMVVPGLQGLAYQTRRPMMEPWFFQNFVRDIPSCADMLDRSSQEETMRFLAGEFSFAAGEIRDARVTEGAGVGVGSTGPAAPATAQAASTAQAGSTAPGVPRAIVPMSFGKDSLLTFAVARELGMQPVMVYVVEPAFENEERHKLAVAREFQQKFGEELFVIQHETGALRSVEFEYGWGLQSTEYALLMLPFYWTTGATRILFGNEQSAGSSYRDQSGSAIVYPCYDQTHHWTRHIDQMTAAVTGGAVRTGSLIEPLMDMLVQGFLGRRYPQYAAFQMSCFVEGTSGAGGNLAQGSNLAAGSNLAQGNNLAAGGESRWCHHCGVCAKMQLLCLASGVAPAAVGFRSSMLTADKRQFFPLLGGDSSFPYARTALARDEQLFAFYCAARRGVQDELVREFAAGPLWAEAQNREPELRERFCTLYQPESTPPSLREATLSIFSEELDAFMRQYQETPV